MDEIGSLNISWAQGYNGSNALFINQNTICYPCGNFVKFLDIRTKNEAIHSSPGEGIGAFTVCGTQNLVAFSENCLSPRIFIFSYPSFTQKVICEDGAQLEYSCLTISSSHPYLISCSGVPDFSVMLWSMESGDLLCQTDIGLLGCNSLSFNPTDWHKVCFLGDEHVTVCTIQQADTQYLLVPSKMSLPFEDGKRPSTGGDLIDRPGSKVANHDLILPSSAIAGIIGDLTDTFDGDFDENKHHVVPSSHCWTPSGDLYVGCRGGQLLLVNTETFDVETMDSDGMKRQNTMNRTKTESSILKMPTVIDESLQEDNAQRLGEGAFSCMTLHRDGLFVGGEDGMLRCLDISGSVVQVSDSCPIDSPITSLSWSPTYSKLAIGSSKGSINLYDTSSPGTSELILDTHHGNFVGLDMLNPGVQHCVTVREDGELQIWDIEENQLVGSLPLAVQCCSLACSPASHSVAVGTHSGHIYMVEVTNMENPRIVERMRVHQHAVMQLTYDAEGRYLFSGSDDGHVFVVDTRPSMMFKVLAQTAIEGHVESISTHMAEKHADVRVVITYTSNDADINIGATKITLFDVPADLNDNVSKYCGSLKMDLLEDSIGKLNFNLNESSHGGAVTGDRKLFTLPHYSKQLHEIRIPEEAPKKANNKASYLQPQQACSNHELAGGVITMSPHHQWVASGGSDGRVFVRELGLLERAVSVHAHNFHSGGVSRMCFTRDGMYLLTCGVGDGVLTCYTWNFSATGKGKVTTAIESARSHKARLHSICKKEDEIMTEMPDWSPLKSNAVSREASTDAMRSKPKTVAMENDQIYVTPTPTPKGDPTWMEVKVMEAIREEDKEFAEQKKTLRTEIRDLRRQIQSMMKENDSLPEIERLERHEFNLDTEDQARLQSEGDEQVQKVREDIEFENLAKSYLKEMVKNECWDSMNVKGRCTKAFHSNLEVSNYPMRKRTNDEKEELACITKLRQIEIAEIMARKEIMESQFKQTTKTENEEADDESVEGDGAEQPSTTGSLGAQYGGASDYFYSQFELHTRQQKRNQIILLKDAIYRIKVAFNSEFDEVYRQKEQEIARIGDRNSRISKILKDLNSSEELWEPEMDEDEKPEKLLTVEEKEVKVEKFITPEQQAKLDDERQIEEQRRLLEKGDNDLVRGREMMMGGVLEVKKEDELKKDVPQPTFIVNKPQDEWSEEEQKMAKEYERKVKELNEEREKYRKTLEAELKKLQTIISDTTSNFDDKMVEIFLKKIKVEMVIFQEELKILRLNLSLLIEEELSTREEELLRQLEDRKMRKVLTVQAVAQTKQRVQDYRDTYDIRVAEDKVLDKNFHKEFHDVNSLLVEQLYKLYRKKPRGQRRLHHTDSKMNQQTTTNPYGERPLSARQAGTLEITLKQLDEFDDPSHMPEDVELSVWKRVCAARRLKVKSEHEVKAQALTLADMNAFLQLRQDEDEKLKREMDDTMDELNQLRESRMRFNCNLEVQFMLKQGQVEIDSGQFIPNYRDSILIHRSVVEDLNGTIRQLGEQKMSAMTESKDFRKGIHILEWEHKKMVMEIEDLLNRAKDIQMLKVSRQIQDYLHNDDHEARKQQEISALEQTLDNQRGHHEKNVKEKKAILSTLRKGIRKKEQENTKVEGELQEMIVCVSERKHINEVNASARDETAAEKRMKDIVQRRKLVDLAKAQAQEVAVLRAEVERLRMRTFPALVQLER
ncbi:cilia- and flagella-associated protein 43-like [Antedon mediterranea]|uniref:cilia- and flagella-associated protein 43-like n=1 Tax=Antedon mediterranea TaxID=105859 RepID=UPI003AF788F7